MAVVPGGIFYGDFIVPNSTLGITYSNITTMQADNRRIAQIVTAPYTGTLRRFGVRLGTVSNAPDNGLRFSFQALDSGWNPDGTQAHYRDVTSGFTANSWLVPSGPLTHNGTDGGNKRSISQNDPIACVIDWVSFVTGDNIAFSALATTANWWDGSNIHTVFNGTSWSASAATIMVLALEYDEFGWVPLHFTFPAVTQVTTTWGPDTNPDERGIRFKVPFNCKLSGVLARTDFGATSSEVVATLYDAADNVLAQGTWLGLHFRDVALNWRKFQADPSITLQAGELYRLTFTTVNGLFGLEGSTIPSADYLKAFQGGADWYATSRNDGGAWSDDQTLHYWIVLQLEEISGLAAGSSYVFLG